MKVFLSLLLIVVSLIGLADASYLTYEKMAGIIPPCSEGFDCETVLTSKWSSIGPIPISAFGMLFYATVFTFSILNYLEKEIKFLKKHFFVATTENILTILTMFGFIFSLYLLFLMGVVIKAWCIFCLISTGTSASLFVINLILISVRNKGEAKNDKDSL